MTSKISIYNTLTDKKEFLEIPATRQYLKLFVCGPTVYDDPHIGNARTYLAFDIIVRYLRFQNINVFYLQNITDIDDKIIDRAQKENAPYQKIARKFEKKYHDNEKALNIKTITKYARATKFIPEIIQQIQILIAKGCAYKIDGDGYYFDISKFPEYGKLSHRTIEAAEDAVTRIDNSLNKRNKGDFTLWKFSDNKPFWKTPIGTGRPGWHIEDTAITEKFFGPQYDLHGGAIDLKFPHHEAEIAEQECASGKKPLVKIWLHAGFLLVNGEKMSKSKNNFITIDEFLENYSANALRYLVLSHHYRSPINYTETLIGQIHNALSSVEDFNAKLKLVIKKGSNKSFQNLLAIDLENMSKEFHAAMSDDFNTPLALAAIFLLINKYNPKIYNLSKKEARQIYKSIFNLFKILGLEFKSDKISEQILKLITEREDARLSKNFSKADSIRQEIEKLNYKVTDTPLGQLVTPIN